MSKAANRALLRAVLEPRKQGAIKEIGESCAAGADPNGICPETSTPNGYVRGGSTLLTHSVHEGAARAVAKLLESGADANLEDDNGWTPWMASTAADESKRQKMQEMLSGYGASSTGEHIGHLLRAIVGRDVDTAASLLQSDRDLEILANFRVDLVGHQIRNHNSPMLEFLLEHNMTPSSTNLLNSIRNQNFAALDTLLRFGMAPEDPEDNETPLMTAASMGDMNMVQRLVEAGADANRYADNNREWTASFYAKKAGKSDVADWLVAHMGKAILENQEQVDAGRNPKYRLLYEQATSGEGFATDEIIAVLDEWDKALGITISAADSDSVSLSFSALPEDLNKFYNEVIGLCPDASENKRRLLNDFRKRKTLTLWWD